MRRYMCNPCGRRSACLKLTRFTLYFCGLNPRSVPGLVLLLSEGCLTSLSISNNFTGILPDDQNPLLFDEPGGIAFGAALRANKTLQVLHLQRVRLWDVLPVGLAVINGVVGHKMLVNFALCSNEVAAENRQMVGDALGRLIAVQSALCTLTLPDCGLSDIGLRPIFQALPGNTNLHGLNLDGENDICTIELAAEVLEAVRQNMSLQHLGCVAGKFPELDAAAAFVSQRLREMRASRG